MAGCPPVEIDRMLTKLAAAYRDERLSDDEAAARRSIYIEGLADIPFDVLSGAFKTALQTCKFFPTVAEIRAKAGPELSKRRWRIFCLKRMVDKHERDWREPIKPEDCLPPEEARAILEETFAKMGVRPESEDRTAAREHSKLRARSGGPDPKGEGQTKRRPRQQRTG